ncbi:hypothetical protein F5878DRAFT_343136 [Lentinula raphanica]|uniref:Uncharacterized protein n=1 Tax=Lentinula raphanica TaxID=153919 RepID=A0AA38U9B1_9AGAR|nr:hypothetical protein F5878DRAFT_343136 [Lentinula raphanica]
MTPKRTQPLTASWINPLFPSPKAIFCRSKVTCLGLNVARNTSDSRLPSTSNHFIERLNAATLTDIFDLKFPPIPSIPIFFLVRATTTYSLSPSPVFMMHIFHHSTRRPLLSFLLIVLLTTNTTLGIPVPIAHLPLYNHHHAHLCTTLPSGRSPAVSVNPYHRVTIPPSRIWYNSLGTHFNPSNPSNPHNPSSPAHSDTPGIPSNPADPSHPVNPVNPVNPPNPAQLTIAFHNPTRYLSSPSYAFLSGVKALLRKAQSENRLLGEIPEDLLFQLRNGLYPKIPTSSTTTGTETNTPTHGPDTDTDALPDLLLTTKSTFVVKGGSCPFHGCAGYIYPAGVSELWNGGCLLTSIDEEGMHGVLRDGMRNFGFAKGALGRMGVPVVPVERDGVHVDVDDRVGGGTSQAESHTTAAAQRHPPNQPNPLDRSNSGPEPASSQPAHDAHTATSSTKPDQHTQLATDSDQ